MSKIRATRILTDFKKKFCIAKAILLHAKQADRIILMHSVTNTLLTGKKEKRKWLNKFCKIQKILYSKKMCFFLVCNKKSTITLQTLQVFGSNVQDIANDVNPDFSHFSHFEEKSRLGPTRCT